MPYNVGIVFRDGTPVTYDSGDYPASQARASKPPDYVVSGRARRRRAARPLSRHRHQQCGGKHRARPLLRARRSASPPPASRRSTPARPRRASRTRRRSPRSPPTNSASATMTRPSPPPTPRRSRFGVGTFAARTAVNAGSSVHIASRRCGQEDQAIAAEHDGSRAGDLELRDGSPSHRFRSAGCRACNVRLCARASARFR